MWELQRPHQEKLGMRATGFGSCKRATPLFSTVGDNTFSRSIDFGPDERCGPSEKLGAIEGGAVGTSDGVPEGKSVGVADGTELGCRLGTVVRIFGTLGPMVGPVVEYASADVGDNEGEAVGVSLGTSEGVDVGCWDGVSVGNAEGACDGPKVRVAEFISH